MPEIRMAGPGKNALGTEMMAFLIEELRVAAGAPVLLTGAGDAFSAGLNLRELGGLEGEQMLAFLRLLERCMTALYLYPGPTVALVNGHAIAGGCVLTLCCDRRVVARRPEIKIGLNEVALGIRFPPRILAIVRQRVPRRAWEEVILGAGLFDPLESLDLGLVDEVVEDASRIARDRLEALAALPSDAYATTKRDLRGTEQDLCSDDLEERFLIDALPSWTSTPVRARIAAALDRGKRS